MSADILQGDAMDAMHRMKDDSADAIITDPPYGLDFRGKYWDTYLPRWINEARRVAKVVAFTTAPTTMWDYPRPDWVCCWYREASNSRSMLGGGFNHWSPVLVYGKPKFPVDSIKLHALQHAYPSGFGHPSPKPVALMAWLVRHTTSEGGLVVDPFAGSGTTGVACVKMGRRFLGIEQDAEYCDLARKRIAATCYAPELALEGAA